MRGAVREMKGLVLYGYTFKILIGDDFFKLEIESELFKIEIDFLKDQARFFMIMGALFYFRARFLSFVDQLLSLSKSATPSYIKYQEKSTKNLNPNPLSPKIRIKIFRSYFLLFNQEKLSQKSQGTTPHTPKKSTFNPSLFPYIKLAINPLNKIKEPHPHPTLKQTL